jgi:hypothetical protein
MAGRVNIAPVVTAEIKPAIIISDQNLPTNLHNFVKAVKKSEIALKTAINELKKEFLTGIFGGNNGGVAGDVV